MKRTLTAVASIMFALGFAGSQGATAAPAMATMTILHGLPHFVADVYVNGKLTLDGFKPETGTPPLGLPAGKYQVAIRSVGAAPTSPPALQATLTLEGGKNYTAMAHLSPAGHPMLTLFTNDLSSIPAGKSRLVLRNCSEAPMFNVLLNGKVTFGSVGPGSQATSYPSPGRYPVEATAAGDGTPLVRSIPLTIHAGDAQYLYVVGSAADHTMDFMFQDIQDLASPPTGVPSGTGGQAGTPGFPRLALALAVAMGVVAAASLLVLGRGRRTA